MPKGMMRSWVLSKCTELAFPMIFNKKKSRMGSTKINMKSDKSLAYTICSGINVGDFKKNKPTPKKGIISGWKTYEMLVSARCIIFFCVNGQQEYQVVPYIWQRYVWQLGNPYLLV